MNSGFFILAPLFDFTQFGLEEDVVLLFVFVPYSSIECRAE